MTQLWTVSDYRGLRTVVFVDENGDQWHGTPDGMRRVPTYQETMDAIERHKEEREGKAFWMGSGI